MSKKIPIKLGLMAPLTGLVELYGKEISHAGIIACKQINAGGGLLGRELELVIGDDGSLPDTAVPCAVELIEKHQCEAIIGNLLSNSRISVNYEVATPKKTPYLNFSFYEGSISGQYFFNFAALPNQQIEKMVPYMAGQFGPKFYFAGSNYEWPRGSIDAAKESLANLEGENVGEEYFDFGTSDYRPLLERVRRSGADVFVPYFAGQDQINLLTQLTELGLKDKVQVVMGHYDEAMVQALSPHVREGFYSSNTYFMSIQTAKNKQYLQQLAELPDVDGIWPNGNGVLTNFGEGTYNCVMAYANAVELAGTTESEAVCKALERVSVEGLQGTLLMDPVTHHATVNSFLSRCNVDGTFEIIENFGAIPPQIPKRYLENFDSSFSEKTKEDSNIVDVHWHILGVIRIANSGNYKPNSNQILLSNINSDLLMELVDDVVVPKLTGTETREAILLDTVFAQKIGSDRIKVEVLDRSQHFIELALFQSEEKYQHSTIDIAFETADISIIVTNEFGIISNINKNALVLFGYSRNEIVNQHVNLIIPPRYRERHNKHIKQFVDSDDIERSMSNRSEIFGYRRDGSEFSMAASISKTIRGEDIQIVVTLRDITHQKKYEDQLIRSATHDALTQLPNRNLIRDRLEMALQRSSHNKHPVVLMFLDLDGFKYINDNYGHNLGDLLLQKVSLRLINHIRPGDTVARFGGDEFLILCEKNTTDTEVMADYIESINSVMRQPVIINDIELFSSVSIGVAMGYGGTHNAEDLLKNADVAMYSVKNKGRDGWLQFDKKMHDDSRIQVTVAKDLPKAIQEKQLTFYLQPIVDIKRNKIVGAEALCRWNNAGKMVSPGIFIPVAELTGQINKIGLLIFEEVCQLLSAWNDHIKAGELEYISVNVSTQQLEDVDLPQKFSAIAQKYNVSPKNIILEVTETAIMNNVEGGIGVLNKLGELGFSLAIDDFGTGYSSLGQLIKLPVDKIKIDKVFIDDVGEKEEIRVLIQAIQQLAHGMKLQIIAEGVENTNQSSLLEELKIDYLQGYLFSVPLPIDQFKKAFFG